MSTVIVADEVDSYLETLRSSIDHSHGELQVDGGTFVPDEFVDADSAEIFEFLSTRVGKNTPVFQLSFGRP